MKYYSGSVLTIEWTNQHGSGRNAKLHSNIVVQYALEQDMEDNCGYLAEDDEETPPWGFNQANTTRCHLRDGYPVNNRNTQQPDDVNGQATDTIPEEMSYQDDYRYGRHETYQYYKQCRYRKRNGVLVFIVFMYLIICSRVFGLRIRTLTTTLELAPHDKTQMVNDMDMNVPKKVNIGHTGIGHPGGISL